MKEFKESHESKLFFTKLYAIKIAAKTVAECSGCDSTSSYMKRIYEMLHELYKTEEEHEKEINTSIINDSNTCMPS